MSSNTKENIHLEVVLHWIGSLGTRWDTATRVMWLHEVVKQVRWSVTFQTWETTQIHRGHLPENRHLWAGAIHHCPPSVHLPWLTTRVVACLRKTWRIPLSLLAKKEDKMWLLVLLLPSQVAASKRFQLPIFWTVVSLIKTTQKAWRRVCSMDIL